MHIVIDDDMPDDDLPVLKKVHGVIPASLFSRIESRGLFKDNWDNWLARAIQRQLEEDVK